MDGRPGPGGTLVCFSVQDCAVDAGRVPAAGGRLLRPKFSFGEFGWVALCADTEGNLFGLSSGSPAALHAGPGCGSRTSSEPIAPQFSRA